MNFLISLQKTINRITAFFGKIAGWLTVLLVFLTCGDVLYRRILGDSRAWMGELEWQVFALIFLLGSAFALRKDKHVRVDLFYAEFSARDKAWVNLAGSILFLIPWCLLILWVAIPFTLQSFSQMEGSAQPDGLPYLWVIKSAIPLCFIMLLLQAVSEIITAIQTLSQSQEEVRQEIYPKIKKR